MGVINFIHCINLCCSRHFGIVIYWISVTERKQKYSVSEKSEEKPNRAELLVEYSFEKSILLDLYINLLTVRNKITLSYDKYTLDTTKLDHF